MVRALMDGGMTRRLSRSKGLDVFLSTESTDQTHESDDLGEGVTVQGAINSYSIMIIL